MTRRRLIGPALLLTWLGAAATAPFASAAQGPAPAAQPPATQGSQPATGRGGTPPPPQNLQVLPKEIPRQELLGTMREFSQGLGVQCNYCHVFEGQGGRNDMAADDKLTKKTARVMLQMTMHVNAELQAGLGKPAADVTRVQCMTCHRGETIPKIPPPAAPPAQQQAQPPVPGI